MIILLTALLPTTAGAGVVIRVPQDQTTIALGLGAAASGDTVRVSCETYFESGLALPDGVVLEAAAWDSGCVVIDGTRRGTILSCISNTSGTVRNITFRDGDATHGGAVYCTNATVTFEYCFFISNSAEAGGAIYWNGGNPEISGCTFTGNAATGSGGAIALFLTGGTVGGSRFEYNQGLVGAGVFTHLLGTTTAFTECEFYANTASSIMEGGGGVYNGQQVATSFLHSTASRWPRRFSTAGSTRMAPTRARACTTRSSRSRRSRNAGSRRTTPSSTAGPCTGTTTMRSSTSASSPTT
jgi:hypothetical protein